MEAFNRNLFLAINGWSGRPWADALNGAVAIASPLFFVAVVALLYWTGRRETALRAGYSALLGLALNFAISLVYFHPRPFMMGLGHAIIQHSPETSFPSDHTTLAFAVAFSLFLSRRLKLGTLLLGAALWTGFARVYAGIHFPLDIVGSVGVAMVAAWLVDRFHHRLSPMDRVINGIWDRLPNVLHRNGA